MKKRFTFILVVVLALKGFGQSFDFNTGSPIPKSYCETIVYETLNNFIILPVIINGKTYKFKYDSGASNIISKELFEEINPRIKARSSMKDVSGQNRVLNVVELDELAIGGLPFKNALAYVLDINSSIYKCNNIDGIIGSCLFRKSIIQLNKEKNTIIITNDKNALSLKTNKYTRMRLSKNQSLPYLKIMVKGGGPGKLSVLFDTGSSSLLEVSDNMYGIGRIGKVVRNLATSEGTSNQGFYGSLPLTKSRLLLLPEIKINSASIQNALAKTTISDNSLLGIELINYGITTIDYRNKKFYFEPYKQSIDLSKNIFGISFSIQNDKLIVGYVWDNELKNQIKYGDQITAINNIDISDINICELKTKQFISESDSVMILYVKPEDGVLKTITIKKKNPEEMTR